MTDPKVQSPLMRHMISVLQISKLFATLLPSARVDRHSPLSTVVFPLSYFVRPFEDRLSSCERVDYQLGLSKIVHIV